jgi:hypothetical protein
MRVRASRTPVHAQQSKERKGERVQAAWRENMHHQSIPLRELAERQQRYS